MNKLFMNSGKFTIRHVRLQQFLTPRKLSTVTLLRDDSKCKDNPASGLSIDFWESVLPYFQGNQLRKWR
jgi:hypothetical protein